MHTSLLTARQCRSTYEEILFQVANICFPETPECFQLLTPLTCLLTCLTLTAFCTLGDEYTYWLTDLVVRFSDLAAYYTFVVNWLTDSTFVMSRLAY